MARENEEDLEKVRGGGNRRLVFKHKMPYIERRSEMECEELKKEWAWVNSASFIKRDKN